MEDIITNFELASTRLLRVCPCCGGFQDKPRNRVEPCATPRRAGTRRGGTTLPAGPGVRPRLYSVNVARTRAESLRYSVPTRARIPSRKKSRRVYTLITAA